MEGNSYTHTIWTFTILEKAVVHLENDKRSPTCLISIKMNNILLTFNKLFHWVIEKKIPKFYKLL